jgi:membrane protein DedA with SNARE-associated domain
MLQEITSILLSTIYSNIFLGIFLGVLIETIFPPIPSEIILPLSGYLLSLNNFSYLGLIIGMLIATFGATISSLIYYYIGLKIGRKFVEKYGKYFLIDKNKLKHADDWFKRHGKKAVFFGRMLPGIRELISLPAGFSRMNLKEYLTYTFFGSLVWSSFLTSIGYFLGENWKSLRLENLSNLIFIAILIILIVYFMLKILVKKYKNK